MKTTETLSFAHIICNITFAIFSIFFHLLSCQLNLAVSRLLGYWPYHDTGVSIQHIAIYYNTLKPGDICIGPSFCNRCIPNISYTLTVCLLFHAQLTSLLSLLLLSIWSQWMSWIYTKVWQFRSRLWKSCIVLPHAAKVCLEMNQQRGNITMKYVLSVNVYHMAAEGTIVPFHYPH